MTREEAKELLPIIQEFAAGKQIQDTIDGSKWFDTDEINFEYEGQKIKHRIKPEPKYRPFKTQEECWNEMLKHKPFGWVKDKEKGALITVTIVNDKHIYFDSIPIVIDKTYDIYEFLDSTPFGIKED